jgi:hypothetical protein
MKTIIHVNQHIIKANRKNGEREAPLTVKDYQENRKGSEVDILDYRGVVVGTFFYRPDAPLACGAEVWFETNCDVLVQ